MNGLGVQCARLSWVRRPERPAEAAVLPPIELVYAVSSDLEPLMTDRQLDCLPFKGAVTLVFLPNRPKLRIEKGRSWINSSPLPSSPTPTLPARLCSLKPRTYQKISGALSRATKQFSPPVDRHSTNPKYIKSQPQE